LLVVVGILALLISLLMPSLSVARQSAQRISCAARLNQQILAAKILEANHKGYYPLVGVLPGIQPQDLDDTYATKYEYLSYPFAGYTRMIAPVTIALAVEMSDRTGVAAVSNNQVGNVETDGRGFIKNFLCPSQAASVSDLTQLPELYIAIPSTGAPICWYTEAMSYIYNEAVLGWGDSDIYGRLKGCSSQIRQQSRTMFAADGLGGVISGTPNRYQSITWTPMATVYNIRTTPPVTLADALKGNGSGVGNAGDYANFDKHRHQGKINIAFFDGHVETRNITGNDLSSVYLLAP